MIFLPSHRSAPISRCSSQFSSMASCEALHFAKQVESIGLSGTSRPRKNRIWCLSDKREDTLSPADPVDSADPLTPCNLATRTHLDIHLRFAAKGFAIGETP